MRQRQIMILRGSFLVFALLMLQGCGTLGYYAQSVNGHLDLMGRSQPVEQLLEDPQVSEALKRRLRLVQQMRAFASQELKLPDNGSYSDFANLDREAVVWSVVATEAFSVEPRQWCYPVIGCASYRGYFSKSRAEAFAKGLSDQGMDVAVEPVPAYSTLGWFDDPLPSTVIEWSEPRLAGLIFHELAHQQLYVNGDSAFNEAFANTVEQAGIVRWLESRPGQGLVEEWERTRDRERQFIDLLLDTRDRLEGIYHQGGSETLLRQRKADELQRLEREYLVLKRRWGGFKGYDRWFERDVNNARLASIATYEAWLPAFELLLQQSQGDFELFYQRCRELGEMPHSQRVAEMSLLMNDVSGPESAQDN